MIKKALRKQLVKYNKSVALEYCPQEKGTCACPSTQKAENPDFAKRKAPNGRLSTGKLTIGYIPGKAHNIVEHYCLGLMWVC